MTAYMVITKSTPTGTGRIDKILHSLRFIDDKDMRRGTLTQLNRE
jgi:hypothetical protein